MGNLLQNIAGMGDLTEQVIVTDMLISAKAGVRNYAMAVSETVTPEVRTVLLRHLDTAIETHEKIANYMMKRGFYNAKDPHEQVRIDMKAADTVLNIQKQ
jgi:similar to spore coat protein